MPAKMKYLNFKLLIIRQDTRNNHEDFALTPYLFLVGKYGFGLCWGWYAIGFILQFNVERILVKYYYFDKHYVKKANNYASQDNNSI